MQAAVSPPSPLTGARNCRQPLLGCLDTVLTCRSSSRVTLLVLAGRALARASSSGLTTAPRGPSIGASCLTKSSKDGSAAKVLSSSGLSPDSSLVAMSALSLPWSAKQHPVVLTAYDPKLAS